MKGIYKTCTYRKHLLTISLTLLTFFFATAQNAIVTENLLPGTPQSTWDIAGTGDPSIQGYATDISVNRGNTIRFKINTNATAYTIDVYRLGYYNGDGARLMGNGVVTATLPQVQPDPLEDAVTGLVDCGNWAESAHWDVPATAVSGVYIAKLIRTDNGGASHIIFIVRNDASTSDLFFQTSDATWQAYNVYGGNSLYVGSVPGYPSGHATKVSYNRPFVTRDGGGGGGPGEDWIFNAEFPMIRFLERNGYDVSYTTNIDAARYGSLLLNHKVFLSVGHDEYWSAEQRNNVEAARAAGVHLAFFSGNEVYWKTRWENSTDISATPYRTLVCYKEGDAGELFCGSKCDNSTSVWTGLWKTGGAYDAGKPENALTGQMSWDATNDVIRIPSQYKDLRLWRNTTIPSMGIESEAVMPLGTLGFESDYEQPSTQYPHGRITMSSTNLSNKVHKLSLYKHSSGAWVFGAGTVQWSWGLDAVHDRGNLPADARMQQATVNLFADMGVQPETLQAGLLTATASTDVTAPQTTITTPVHNATVTLGNSVTISGTSTDVGGVVAGTEISVDGGTIWIPINGLGGSWSYTWTPQAIGTATIKVRSFDDSGNMETAGTAPATNAITLTVDNPVCPCTIFPNGSTPASTNIFDNAGGNNLGVKFVSNLNGFITGIRFYKSTNDIGTHTGSLWTSTGTLLRQGVFVNETASGWQQMTFGTPVAITAGQTYVVSYYSPTGYYAETPSFFGTAYTGNPLSAIGSGDAGGPNGIFLYAATPAFPTNTFNASNYWVDAVFNTTAAPDATAPYILSTTPTDFTGQVSTTPVIKAVFDEAIDPLTVTSTTFELRNQNNVAIPATLSAAQNEITLTPTSALTNSAYYTVTVKSGAAGVKDIAGNPLAADSTWTFSVVDPAPIAPTEGYGGPILVISSTANKFSRYTTEILRAEGLTAFTALDITAVNATVLNNYDVVILGEMAVDAAQATMFTNWVNAGGTFIAFRPSVELSSLLGITKVTGTLADQYIRVKTTGPGKGIVSQTIQFHGTADYYSANAGAVSLATLYSSATAPTIYPAATMRPVGSNGGKAYAFTYDLVKSIVYTRQGNPAWIGQDRDGQAPIRSNDLFFGNTEPDWVNLNKVAIPQADEQQRFLVNMIIQGSLHRKPLPRLWFLPDGHKAAIVMTGDDHGGNSTGARFTEYMAMGNNSPKDVADWKAIRSTSYLYPNNGMTNAQLVNYQSKGFEIALHLNTGCANYTPVSLQANLSTQLSQIAAAYPGMNAPVTNRTHCLVWSDWATAAKVQAQNGVRLDANYYYWPGTWIQNRPGMFTGSGMPMRFADTDGTLIDCYQMPTQMTDESDIEYNTFCNALLDKAIGAEGYYGVFAANMHTDVAYNPGSVAIIASAMTRNIPVISAKQMLTWLDGRNNSYFGTMTWAGNQLSFDMTVKSGAYNLKAMLPLKCANGTLQSITRDGNAVSFTTQTIKGIEYAFFTGLTGSHVATYSTIPTGTLTGTVALQGRPAAPHARLVVPVQVDLYAAGNNTTPVYSYTATTDQNGIFTIENVPSGTYNIAVKNSHTLQRVRTAQTIATGNNAINFGTLLEGDVNDNNFIDGLDLSLLISSFYKGLLNSGYDNRSDLNGNGFVDGLDLSILISNFYQLGEAP